MGGATQGLSSEAALTHVAPAAPSPDAGAARRPRRSGRSPSWARWWWRAASVAVVAALFAALFGRVADVGDVVAVARDDVGWGELGVLAALTAASLAASFWAMICALPGLGFRDAAQVNVTTTAVAYGVPGGAAAATALTVAMLRALGFDARAVTLELLITGIWNMAVKVGLPVVAFAVLALAGGAVPGLAIAAVIAMAALVGAGVVGWLCLRDVQVAAAVGRAAQRVRNRVQRLRGRSPAGDAEAALVRFRADTAGLVRRRGWALTAATLGYHLALFGVLAVALVAVDTQGVSILEAFAVFSVARQLSAIPVTPGGAGVVELGLVGGLGLAGGNAAPVTAAVLLYRGFTFWAYLPAGPLVWTWWRRRHWSGVGGAEPSDGRVVGADPDPASGPSRSAAGVAAGRSYRHPGDVGRVLGGLALVAGLGLFAAGGRVVRAEADVFRLVNDLPDALSGPLWLVMQVGWVGAVPLATGIAALARRRRLAVDLAAGGLGAWLAAKAVKLLFHRARPGAILGDVVLRGVAEAGHGFVSGHAAVAAALATVAAGHTSRRTRRAAWVGVWLVALARVFVGAHLPLDVLGGAALGWAVGGIVHLARGTPGHVPAPTEIAAALAGAGWGPSTVEPLSVDARGSIPYRATSAAGVLFVKAMGRDQRDADLLYRLGRFLAFRETGDEAPFATPKHQLEHEAYLALLATRAGVRVPEVVLSTSTGDETWLEAQRFVDAVPLSRLDPDRIDDALLTDLWTQVARSRAAGLAHRDLRLANVMVDPAGRCWLVDWGFGEAGATARVLDRDVAELLAATATVVGPGRAVAAAVATVGPEAVAGAAPLLQPLALSAGTRRGVLAVPGLLEALRSALAARGITVPADRQELVRLPLRPAVLASAVLAGWTLHHLVTRVAGLSELIDVVAGGSWRWLVGAGFAAAAAYPAAAVQLGAAARMAATPLALAFGRTTLMQLAGSFVSKRAAPGQGSAALNRCYLRCSGLDPTEANRVVSRGRVAGLVVHAFGLVAAWAWFARSRIRAGTLSGAVVALAVAAAALLVAGVLVRHLHQGATVRSTLADLRLLRPLPVSSRLRHATVALLAGAAGVTAARLLALAGSLWAFGGEPSLIATAAVYLTVSALSPLGPLPGGLGIVEAGLVVGLTAVGVPAAPAVAGVLAYRLLTFWLPIIPGAFAYRRLRCSGSC